MQILNSHITQVTVFTDRAQITRIATVTIKKGENKVAFDQLPDSIIEKSVQVNGNGNATLNDIKFKKVYYEEYPHEKVKTLHGKISELQKSQAEISDAIEIARKEKSFVENIASKLTAENSSEQASQPILDPEKWIKMVDFYRSKNEKLSAEIRELNRKNADLQNSLNKYKNELKEIGANQSKKRNQVQVDLETDEPETEMVLELKYITYGASWYPFYDLRASSTHKKVDIAYNAMVTQTTGENWEDANVKISTAQVQVSGKIPELNPWYIDFYRPPVERSAMVRRKSKMSFKESAKTSGNEKFDDFMDAAMPKKKAEKPKMKTKQAKAETGATSVVFNIPGRNSINSDNIPHKLSIIMRELPAEFFYTTVPKISPFAYLKTEITNDTEFPFLEGETNIFLDGSFVANSNLKLVAPKQKFEASLGVDEGIKVEHKLINKFRKDKGFMSKKQNTVYEYEILITNNKTDKQKIAVIDQLPISQNNEIQVELIKPKYKEDTDQLKIDNQKKITWNYGPGTGEKIKIEFSFAVEYPQDETVTGI